MSRTARYWLVAGWIAVLLLPWYALEDGLFASGWLTDAWSEDVAPLAVQASRHGRTWLWPILAILALPLLVWRRPKGDAFGTALLIGVGAAGIAWMLLQGFAIGLRGWSWPWLATLAGDLESRQLGMGWGALLAGASFLFLFTEGLAARGALRGDAFVLGVVALVVAGTALFVFYPVALVLVGGGKTDDGYSIIAFGGRLVSSDIWSLGCVAGARS